MRQKPGHIRKDFQVLCVWCGAKIRKDRDENSFGVCLQCFYRILDEYLRAQKGSGQFASDR